MDDKAYRKSMLQLLQLTLELTITVHAMNAVLNQTVGESFGELVRLEREKLEPGAKKVLDQFKAAQIAEWTAMLHQLNTKPH